MQTYEVQPGQTMDALLDALNTLAQSDRAITLVVPERAALLTQVENLSRLRQVATTQGVQLRAVVVDQVTLGLFRIMGFDASQTPASPAPPPAPTAEAMRITSPPAPFPAPPPPAPPPMPAASVSSLPQSTWDMSFDL